MCKQGRGWAATKRVVWRVVLLGGWLASACTGDAQLSGDGSTDDASPVPSADAGPFDPDASPAADAAGPDANVTLPSPWTELSAKTVSLAGGAARSGDGHAHAGGTMHLVSRGGIVFDADATAPAAPQVEATPADALRPTALADDVDAPGAVVIEGHVASSGTGDVRIVRAGGDLYVLGTLRAGVTGGARQAVHLSASGTVYVSASGLVDASGSGPGEAGGAIDIQGRRIVILGRLSSDGGGGAGPGASAGAIRLRATEAIFVGGTLDGRGGDGRDAGDIVGGAGGDLTLQAGGDVILVGRVRVRGGAATSTGGTAEGGAAGTTIANSDASVTIGGTFDARGGVAGSDADAASVTGGAAGALRVGESAAPTRVLLLAETDLSGGDGRSVGGDGGTVLLQPRAADLEVRSRLSVNGGLSAHLPGAGGLIEGHPGPDTALVDDAGLFIAAEISATGGSTTLGALGDGAAGGQIKLVNLSTFGALTVTTTGIVNVDGGRSAGTGTAGAGGVAYLFTRDGNASIAGQLLARGGDAPDAGGQGGAGGFLYVFTDDDHGGPGPGILRIESSGVVDASGGSGTIGGSARNYGHVGEVASWPVTQDNEYDVRQIAVLINSDGVHGGATGWIENHGLVRARGVHANGSGGDVFFHGKAPDGDPVPIPGHIDDAGDGTGTPGTFGGKHVIIVGPTM